MNKYTILQVLLILSLGSCMQPCVTFSDCPINAGCSYQGYCQCAPNFIYNCSTPATILNDGDQLDSWSSSISDYYYIFNFTTGQQMYYQISFQVDGLMSADAYFKMQINIDQGINNPPGYSYNVQQVSKKSKNILVAKISLNLQKMPGTNTPERCILIMTPFMANPPSVRVSFYSYEISNLSIMVIIGYAMGGLLLVGSIISIVLLYRKRETIRRIINKKQNNAIDISHFDNLMPLRPIEGEQKSKHPSCSVCLQEFQITSQVRATPCKHIFHKTCLDQWALKQLNCPMCRTQLTIQRIIYLNIQAQMKQNNQQWNSNPLYSQRKQNESIRERLVVQHINNDNL